MMFRNFYFLDVITYGGFFKALFARDTHRNIYGWNNRRSVLCFKIAQKGRNWVGAGMGQGQSGVNVGVQEVIILLYFYVCSKSAIIIKDRPVSLP